MTLRASLALLVCEAVGSHRRKEHTKTAEAGARVMCDVCSVHGVAENGKRGRGHSCRSLSAALKELSFVESSSAVWRLAQLFIVLRAAH